MKLYIIRHAWAYEHGDPRWPDDRKRPLETEGAERMARVIDAIRSRGFAPEIIATSPYLRCRQTADVVSANLSAKPRIVELAALAPGSDFPALAQWTAGTECESVAWVGHAPDVGSLAALVIGDGSASVRFPKGAVAAIRVEDEIGVDVACGELEWLATAKILGV